MSVISHTKKVILEELHPFCNLLPRKHDVEVAVSLLQFLAQKKRLEKASPISYAKKVALRELYPVYPA